MKKKNNFYSPQKTAFTDFCPDLARTTDGVVSRHKRNVKPNPPAHFQTTENHTAAYLRSEESCVIKPSWFVMKLDDDEIESSTSASLDHVVTLGRMNRPLFSLKKL